MTDPPAGSKRSFFVRSIYAGRDIELFVVVAVATILTVRSILAATGWPQLGGGKIHFAHLLWGGLGMLIALILYMAMEGRLWKQLATLAAGIGFGLFIDELGKFITSDNDYFFQPVFAFIYLIFIAIFIVSRAFLTTDHPSPQAALVNLFRLASEGAVRQWDDSERAQALQLLAACDQGDPVVQQLTPVVTGLATRTSGRQGAYERVKARLEGFYAALVERRWFKALLIGYLAVLALSGIVLGLAVIAAASGEGSAMDFWTYGEALSACVSAILVVVGFVRWRRSRLAAFRWFLRALLVSIFVTQFFAFYNNQITQVFGLIVVLLTYAALRGMFGRERIRQPEAGGDETSSLPSQPQA
jgi:uncharacterized membrane protein (UPF0136 family)